MKKQLLTFALAAISSVSFAQFTITGTSVTYTGNTVPAETSAGTFYSNQPNNNGNGGLFGDAACSTPVTQGPAGEVGGFDPAVHPDATKGVNFYGGKIRTVYYGAPCSPNAPSIGFHTGKGGVSGGIGTGTDVNLSSAANQKIQFEYKSDATMTVFLQLFDGAYNPKLNENGEVITLSNDNQFHTVTIDFSDNIATGADLSNVRQVSLIYNSTTASPNFGITLANIKLGSVLASTNSRADVIAASKLYPNPAAATATVELNLKSTSNVKVVVADLVGKEMKVVANGSFSSLNETFSVADLAQGLYTVTYMIDGVPAKTESLMVK